MIFLKEIQLKEMPPEDSYLHDMPVIKYLDSAGGLQFSQPVTFFIGDNGTGKSTLLEAIAVALGFNAEGGSRDFQFSTKDSHSPLHKHLTTIREMPIHEGFFLRAESFYNTASYLDENGNLAQRYGGVPLHDQSHGESFLALISNRFNKSGLYLLDEPEAALSPARLLSLLIMIDNMVKDDSQLIIATHSPILMAYPQAQILQFSDAGIEKVAYQETDQYTITKRFLDDPDRMLRYLLDE